MANLIKLRAQKAKALAEGRQCEAAKDAMALAALHLFEKEYSEARKEYTDVVDLSSAATSDKKTACRAICDLDVDHLQVVTEETYACARSYLRLSQEEHDRVNEQRAYLTLGRVLEALDRLEEGAEYYRQAAAAVQRVPDKAVTATERFEMRAAVLYNLARIYKSINQDVKLSRCLDDLQEIIDGEERVTVVKKYHFRCLVERSALLFSKREEAERLTAKALDLSRDLGREPSLPDLYQMRAKLLLSLGRIMDAERLIKEGKKSFKASVERDFFNVARGVGKVAKAVKNLEKCAEDAHQTRQKLLEEQGDLFSRLKLYKEAGKRYEASLKILQGHKQMIQDQKRQADLLFSIAMCYFDEGLYSKAKEYFINDLTIRKGSGDFEGAIASWGKVSKS